MSYSAGSAFLEIVPSFRGVAESISAEMRRAGEISGKVYADAFNRAARGAVDVALGPSRAEALRSGTQAGGSFADGFRARVTAALRDLPQPNVGVDATELDAELADIRVRLQALSSVRVGVDIKSGDAIAELDLLKARLDELGARSPDIQVKADAAAAAAELAAVRAEMAALDGSTAKISVDDNGSIGSAAGGLSGLATAGFALGPAIVPAAASAAAGVAGIASAALSAAGGLGTLVVGFSGISKAVNELTAAHDATAASAAKSGAAQVAAAAAVANAEQQLKDARRAVADAERSGAQSIEGALRRQQDAEVTLATAQRTARQAQLDLSAARRAAKQDLEDLTLQVQDGALAQRQANLDVANARQNLAQTLNNPSSTALQRQQAQLAYEQAVQQVTDLTVRQRRLVEQQAAASKAGVAGAAGVVAATQRVKATQDAVVKAQRDERVAAAAVTEARRAAAESVVKAQERVISAERQLQVAHAQAATAASAGAATTLKAFDALGPAGQRLATFIATTVVPAFKHLRDVIQANLLPGIEQGLKTLAPLLPGLTAVAASLAKTMGDLFTAAAQALTGPFWSQFAVFIGSTIGPNLKTLAGILGNVATGFAGLLQAFGPVVDQIGRGLSALTGQFANFGTTTGGNSGFQRFLTYIRDVGPKVVDVLGKVVDAAAHIVTALAPLGPIVLSSIGVLADIITKIPAPVLTALAAGFLAIALGIKAWAVAQFILNTAMLVFDTVASPFLILIAGAALTVLAIVAAVALLGVGIYELVKHWDTVWGAITDSARAVGRFFTGPFVNAFKTAWRDVGRAATALWTDAIRPAFKFIVDLWFTVVGALVNGAASAFGWVPGLGGKLKSAAKAFDKFRDDVNAALDGIKDRDIKVGAQLKLDSTTNQNLHNVAPGTIGRAYGASGGWVAGGIPGKDSVPAMLMPGEFVVAADMSNLSDLLSGVAGGSRPVASPTALAAVAAGGRGGLSIGELNVVAAPGERAEVSVPRALRQHAFVSGLWDLG